MPSRQNARPAQPDPSTAERHVDIWYATASADTPGAIESTCENWLTPEEQTQADRFRRPTSRNQHVVGRGMARRLLGGESVDATSIRFKQLEHGKPEVVGPPDARQSFNVAHTEGLVLCGIVDGERELLLGVDVERLQRRTDAALARRYFAAPEVDALQAVPEGPERQSMFLRIWTLKESFIKAIGTGLHTPLADFAFEDIESDHPRLRILNPDLEQGAHWRFHCTTPRPGFVAAVAISGSCPEVIDACRIRWQSFDQLIRREGRL